MDLLTIPIAVLDFDSYSQWWLNKIDRRTRNMIRKSWKLGVDVKQVQPDDTFWRGVAAIFNETPKRRGTPYRHYGKTVEESKQVFEPYQDPVNNVYFGAYHQNELIGFLHLLNEEGWMVSAILCYQKHFDKAPMNAMVDKMVRYCCDNKIGRVTYGRMQTDGLGKFKRSNGFREKRVPRFFKGNIV